MIEILPKGFKVKSKSGKDLEIISFIKRGDGCYYYETIDTAEKKFNANKHMIAIPFGTHRTMLKKTDHTCTLTRVKRGDKFNIHTAEDLPWLPILMYKNGRVANYDKMPDSIRHEYNSTLLELGLKNDK